MIHSNAVLFVLKLLDSLSLVHLSLLILVNTRNQIPLFSMLLKIMERLWMSCLTYSTFGEMQIYL